MNKIHFTSLGCPRNFVDTETMLGIVMEAGYNITLDEQEADFLIVNTCGFLEEARQEALDNIQDLFDLKKDSAKVIVTGCMVKNHRYILEEEFPDIHYYLGSGDIADILKSLSDHKGECVSSSSSFIDDGTKKRFIATPGHYAYLKISEGCRKRCSFCLIPDIKGPLRSRKIDDIVKEFKDLLDQGIYEIILIAQDLGDYGKDLMEKPALSDLLKALLDVDNDFWLRLMYLYPDEIDDNLVDIIKSDKRICPYLDMPLQHINDNILKRMARKTSRNDIFNVLDKLHKKIPEMVVRSSIIVGFPGESNAEFEELLQFVKDYELDNLGVFKYSQEEGTPAAAMADQVPEETKEERYHRLMKTQQEVVEKKNKSMVGKILPVLVDGYHPDSELLISGRTQGQCPDIDGMVIINDPTNIESFGKVYPVEITDIAGYDLIGHVVS